MVQMGPGGVIAPPEDVEAFSTGIAQILEHPAMRDSLRDGARRSVIENYTLDLHCARYVSLYEERIAQWREAKAHA
jgi:glycosyltransferase involved in cell wall biosynthesis